MENKHTEGKARIEKDLITGELSMLIGITPILTITSGENYEHNAKYVAQAWNEHDQLTEQVKQLQEENNSLRQSLDEMIFLHNTSERTLTDEWLKKVQKAKSLVLLSKHKTF